MLVVRRYLLPLVAGLAWAAPLDAQVSTGSISGRVVEATSQQPLSDVNVAIVGTTQGAVTRADGSFTIVGVAPGTRRLRASRIGFAPVEQDVAVTAAATATVNFALESRAAVLSPMVVVGYGEQRRESITGSVATVDADAANVGVVTNANQMLQGRVAGVHITPNNGEPGGGAQVRIRGGTSISASNDPLYVVDGVPLQNETPVAEARGVAGINPALSRSGLNSINPNDIESITVLKDASATAIYGSRGANGVILIETKRGARGGSALVEYDVYVAAAAPARKLGFLSGDEYRSFIEQQVAAGELAESRLDALGPANTNWEDELTRTGYATNHNLSFSGGTEATQYRASLNYFDQTGVVLSNGLKRYQGRLNANHQALDGRLQLGVNLTASRVNNDYLPFENTGGFEGGVFTNMAVFNPTRPVRVTDETTGEEAFYEIGSGAQGVRNPVALAQQVDDESPENRILGNVTGSFRLFEGLTSRTTLGVDYSSSLRQTYFPLVSPVGAQFNGLARQAQRNLQNLNFQQQVTFTPQLSDRHGFEVLGGYEYSRFDNSGFEVVMQGFITDAFRWNNLGAGTQAGSPPPGSYIQESKLVSFFSRASYSFDNRYFLTGVVRRDGSSRLAPGNQWSVFPGVSASWRLSEEAFMRDRTGPFSSLALRAGWGRQGNQAVRPYATELLLRADNGARYPFGGTITTGLVAGQIANPNLKWETSDQVNIGLDYGFMNERFTGALDLYRKTTRDLLLDVDVPQPAVVRTRVENIGSIRNRGMEASINAQLIDGVTRSLSSGLVLAVERGEVLSLGEDREFIITGGVSGQGQSGRFSQRIIPGQPLGTFWGARFLRVNEEGQQVFQCSTDREGCVAGETTAPTGDDEMIIGDANPAFSVGLTSSAIWSRFDFSWLWRAEAGRDVFNNTALVYSTKGNALADRNFLSSALDDPTGLREPAIYSSRWIEDGSFVRLQNATIGYTFNLPTRFAGGRSTRIYLSGDNLLLFTGYSGYDPEVFVSSGLASRGIDYLTYPRARTVTTGARIQF